MTTNILHHIDQCLHYVYGDKGICIVSGWALLGENRLVAVCGKEVALLQASFWPRPDIAMLYGEYGAIKQGGAGFAGAASAPNSQITFAAATTTQSTQLSAVNAKQVLTLASLLDSILSLPIPLAFSLRAYATIAKELFPTLAAFAKDMPLFQMPIRQIANANPLLSIIIASKDGDPGVQLNTLSKDPWILENCEIIFICDRAEAQERYINILDKYRHIPIRPCILNEGIGLPAAWNRGADIARGTNLLFMQENILPVDPGCIARMTHSLSDSPNIGIAGCAIQYQNETVGGADIHLYPAFHGCVTASRNPPAVGEKPEIVKYLSDTALLVRREAFMSSGGFKPIFLDSSLAVAELCLRCSNQGWKSVKMNQWRMASVGASQKKGPMETRRNLWDSSIFQLSIKPAGKI